MSFYCKNLEDTIFNAHERELVETPDELIIISGYLGPAPVDRLKKLPFKTTVIAGMYKLGVNNKLYKSLRHSMKNNPKLNVYFSNIEVHSKIYIWMKRGTPKYVLIGSANFSNNGLRTNYRESLADMDIRNTTQLLDYYNLVLSHSTETPEILLGTPDTYKINKSNDNGKSLVVNDDINNGELSINLPLYVQKNNVRYVPKKSGLNWGLSNGHTAEGDAYIKIPKSLTKDVPDFFPPYDPEYKSQNSRRRASDPIEIIWDDGKIMEASAEGRQESPNGLWYPKQIASYSLNAKKDKKISAKSILGRYIRKRMNLPVNYEIQYSDLEKYGRTSINFTKVSDGVYSADFSVMKK